VLSLLKHTIRVFPQPARDRGMLATIGRAQAVAQIGPIHTYGPQAWAFWYVVHIFFRIGLRNRIRVMSE
jgi:NADH:ubiquinone reductase (H+-translocating)